MSEPDDMPDPLTRREREVLEGILDHKTAKQMGLEHGVSHHAIEKRLKRARQKLGAESSLDAAKLYRERYGRPVSGPPELAGADEDDHRVDEPAPAGFRWIGKRMIVMSMLFIAALGAAGFGLHSAQPADQPTGTEAMEKSLESEVEAAHRLFTRIDTDGSSFLDLQEFTATLSMENLKVDNLPAGIDLEAAMAAVQRRRGAIFAVFDRNEDGRIDLDEFTSGHLEGLGPRYFDRSDREALPGGLPTKYSTRIGIRAKNGDDIHRAAFKMADRDQSGAIDLDEFVNLSPSRRAATSERSPDQVAAATKIFRFMDSDENGTIDRNEFATVTFTDDEGNAYEFEVFDQARG
ncbi:EF-hand domain-containing protein [Sphingomicrobium sp. XHP0235]|uniref:EF-hand domain-containing protein n=1 Tax=Sphingomicrobium aquimarinum TaxID=3133971 RepID=UPI0031FEFF26